MLDGICVQSYENSQREICGTEKPKRHIQGQKLEEKDIHQIPSEELIAHISSTGFDPQILSRLSGIGARPIKRMIQKELLNELSGADHRRDVGARRGAGDRCVRWEDSRFGGTGCGAQAHRGKGEEREWEEEGESLRLHPNFAMP